MTVTPSFELKMRTLLDEATSILPRLSPTDLKTSFEFHSLLAQASEDEMNRRGNSK